MEEVATNGDRVFRINNHPATVQFLFNRSPQTITTATTIITIKILQITILDQTSGRQSTHPIIPFERMPIVLAIIPNNIPLE